MSAANVSRIETGYQGPPPDEVVQQLAAGLGVDPVELLTLAGRAIGRDASFEERVLAEQHEIRLEIRAAFRRLRLQLPTDRRSGP